MGVFLGYPRIRLDGEGQQPHVARQWLGKQFVKYGDALVRFSHAQQDGGFFYFGGLGKLRCSRPQSLEDGEGRFQRVDGVALLCRLSCQEEGRRFQGAVRVFGGEGLEHQLGFMEVAVFVQEFSKFEVQGIGLLSILVQNNGLPACLDGLRPFLEVFRQQDFQAAELHGLVRGELFFFQQREGGLHSLDVRRIEIQSHFRLVQARLGFQSGVFRHGHEASQKFRGFRVHSFGRIVSLFKEDVFPQLCRACGFPDQGGRAFRVVGMQGRQVFIEERGFRRFFRAAPGRFTE